MPERACPVGGPGSPRRLDRVEPLHAPCTAAGEARALETPLDLTIRSLASSGEGVARTSDGCVVFVPFTAPGDRVRVRVTERRRRYARGRVMELLEPSPERVDPPCAVFGSCGGCTWQHVRYRTQVEAKSAIVRDALERVGGLSLPDSFRLVSSPSEYGYRQRVRLVWHEGGWHFRRRRSRALCAVDRCPVLVPSLDKALRENAIRGPGDPGRTGGAERPRRPRRAHGRTASPGEWELACGSDGGVVITPAAGRPSEPPPRLVLRVGDERLEISGRAFLQANAPLLNALVETVLEEAGTGCETLELYAGAGLFTLGLARRFARVTAIESQRVAARDLGSNLRRAKLGGVRVISDSVEHALGGHELPRRPLDAIVLDPPRTGLSPEAARTLLRWPARRVVYVSCEPATLARDLARWVRAGWRLARVTGFDLMPQTPHVEVVATLDRVS